MQPRHWLFMRQKSAGLSLAEVSVALTLVGVLAAISIFTLVSSHGERTAIERCKNITEQILKARRAFSANQLDTNPTAEQLADLTNYTVKVNCGANLFADQEFLCGTCHCYQYADGGLLQVNGVAEITNPAKFSYDPDGAARPLSTGYGPVALRLYHDSGRITTLGADTNDNTKDPTYAQAWTKL